MDVIIADDSKAMRMLVLRALRHAGFSVTAREAADGKEALELVKESVPDLILSDWNMPVMNGYELVCAVRANVLLSHIRIMMVTTETSITQVEKALAAGANEYLMKPFTKEQLLEKLTILGLI